MPIMPMLTHSGDKKCFEKRNGNVAGRAIIRADVTITDTFWVFFFAF